MDSTSDFFTQLTEKTMAAEQNIIAHSEQLFEESDITKYEFAKLLKVGKQTIYRIYTGEKKASVDFLIALSLYFDVSVDYLLGLSDCRSINDGTTGVVQRMLVQIANVAFSQEDDQSEVKKVLSDINKFMEERYGETSATTAEQG